MEGGITIKMGGMVTVPTVLHKDCNVYSQEVNTNALVLQALMLHVLSFDMNVL